MNALLVSELKLRHSKWEARAAELEWQWASAADAHADSLADLARHARQMVDDYAGLLRVAEGTETVR